MEANVWYVKAAGNGDQRAKDRLAVINSAATDGTANKKNKKNKKDKPEGRRKSEDKECRIM